MGKVPIRLTEASLAKFILLPNDLLFYHGLGLQSRWDRGGHIFDCWFEQALVQFSTDIMRS